MNITEQYGICSKKDYEDALKRLDELKRSYEIVTETKKNLFVYDRLIACVSKFLIEKKINMTDKTISFLIDDSLIETIKKSYEQIKEEAEDYSIWLR